MNRDMTADELERFEREALHHEEDAKPETRAARVSDLVQDEARSQERPATRIPPNPD